MEGTLLTVAWVSHNQGVWWLTCHLERKLPMAVTCSNADKLLPWDSFLRNLLCTHSLHTCTKASGQTHRSLLLVAESTVAVSIDTEQLKGVSYGLAQCTITPWSHTKASSPSYLCGATSKAFCVANKVHPVPLELARMFADAFGISGEGKSVTRENNSFCSLWL